MSNPGGRVDVTPANLAFLTIYNPSLSDSDETLRDQILYYHGSDNSQVSRPEERDREPSDVENERLRQIGLAQGMVEFAKYAQGRNVTELPLNSL